MKAFPIWFHISKNQLTISSNFEYLVRVVYKEITFLYKNLWLEIHFHSWTIRGFAIVGINDKGSMHQISARNSNSTFYFPPELEVKNLNDFKDRMSGWKGAHSWKNLRKHSHCLVHLFYWFNAIANVPQFLNLDRTALFPNRQNRKEYTVVSSCRGQHKLNPFSKAYTIKKKHWENFAVVL